MRGGRPARSRRCWRETTCHEQQVPQLTDAQILMIREAAVLEMAGSGLPEDRSAQVADAIVGHLVLAARKTSESA